VSWRLGLWSEWIDPGDDSPGSAGAVATGEERVNHESVHDAEGVAVGLEPGAAEPVGEDARADPDAQEAPPSSAAEPPAEPPGSIERAGPTDSTVEHHPPAAGTDAEPIELGTLLVNARPPSTLSIDGVDMGSTHWVGELPPGPHRVELVTGDGRRVTRTVNVYAAHTAKLCWDFGLGAECPK